MRSNTGLEGAQHCRKDNVIAGGGRLGDGPDWQPDGHLRGAWDVTQDGNSVDGGGRLWC